MDTDSRHGVAIAAGVLAALLGTGYVVANVTSCEETWQWAGKRYEPAYSYWTSHCVSYNKHGACQISVPVQVHVPEKHLWIWRDCTGDKHDRAVTAAEYEGRGDTFQTKTTRWKECPCRARRGDW